MALKKSSGLWDLFFLSAIPHKVPQNLLDSWGLDTIYDPEVTQHIRLGVEKEHWFDETVIYAVRWYEY